MLQRIRGILRPEAFHGHLFDPPFFEGWYVKLIDASVEERLALIAGIIHTSRAGSEHAFIQLFDGLRGKSANLRFSVDQFEASAERMDAQLGGLRLTGSALEVAIERDDGSLRGNIHFDSLSPWPVTWRSPGVMGWYAWMPFMECYHGVVSMDHAVSGAIEWDGRRYDFDGGRGYLEKDWGRAFPSSWIWLQSNHFADRGTSLMASIARIPWIGRSFPGFIVGFLHDGQLYRLTEYTGAKVERLVVSERTVDWLLRDRRHTLEILAHRGKTTPLIGPTLDGMERTVNETLSARVDVKLTRRGVGGGVLFEGAGVAAGMEVHGAMAELGGKSG